MRCAKLLRDWPSDFQKRADFSRPCSYGDYKCRVFTRGRHIACVVRLGRRKPQCLVVSVHCLLRHGLRLGVARQLAYTGGGIFVWSRLRFCHCVVGQYSGCDVRISSWALLSARLGSGKAPRVAKIRGVRRCRRGARRGGGVADAALADFSIQLTQLRFRINPSQT